MVNAVLLGSLQQTLDALAACRLCATVTQLQAARGLPLAGDLRLAADNPVFIISARKEPENA